LGTSRHYKLRALFLPSQFPPEPVFLRIARMDNLGAKLEGYVEVSFTIIEVGLDTNLCGAHAYPPSPS
jgi:hypothetical protein